MGDSSNAFPAPGDAQQAGTGGGFPSEPSAQPDPRDMQATMLVAQIVQAARRLGTMYPAAIEEMRTITNAMSRAQMKIVNSKPAPEVSAPPV